MRRNLGFTLVEVMIASIILFSVITLLYQVVAQSTHSSDIATKNLEIHSVLPLIAGQIKKELDGKFSPKTIQGDGALLGISFNWSAEQLKSEPFLESISNEGFGLKGMAKLWKIKLELTSRDRKKILFYQEVTW
ncbi:MAG: PulJ/GspJ family protein [Thalassotalea sp.]